MFNAICPDVFQMLRERAGLTQAELADTLKVSRRTVMRFECGQAHPDKEQERRLRELAKCSNEEFAELVCKRLSQWIQRPVAIVASHGAYEPTTALARAYGVVREHAERLSGALLRALNNKINTTQLMGLAFDRHNADLMELTRDCLTEAATRGERPE